MFIKKIKKKCGVRGCKNISDVFIISRRREMGNTVAICRQCMADALKATDGYFEPKKPKAVSKPLFPHPELKVKSDVTLSSVADIEEPKPIEVIDAETEDTTIESVAEDTVTTPQEEPVAPPKSKATAKSVKKGNKKKK